MLAAPPSLGMKSSADCYFEAVGATAGVTGGILTSGTVHSA